MGPGGEDRAVGGHRNNSDKAGPGFHQGTGGRGGEKGYILDILSRGR